ncbi:TPA: hypothetical protein EYP12_05880 [Candidatus Bipolaricaulota bacterium]|nr:hypothetical protein [Candidatus Bipolaricaulota bacterium]
MSARSLRRSLRRSGRSIYLLFRADEIARARLKLKRLHLRQADLVIRPQVSYFQRRRHRRPSLNWSGYCDDLHSLQR